MAGLFLSQEGACATVLSDIRQRVCSQLALVVMDAGMQEGREK